MFLWFSKHLLDLQYCQFFNGLSLYLSIQQTTVNKISFSRGKILIWKLKVSTATNWLFASFAALYSPTESVSQSNVNDLRVLTTKPLKNVVQCLVTNLYHRFCRTQTIKCYSILFEMWVSSNLVLWSVLKIRYP